MSTLIERASLPAGIGDQVVARMWPAKSPYVNDPDLYARERLGLESWSIPRRIRESVIRNRHTAVPACHESAKTHTAATIAAWWAEVHPAHDTLVFTTAPENHQVVELLWGDLTAIHAQAGLPGQITKDARWFIGSSLVARGKKTSDLSNPAQAMQSMQGRHARYPLVIIDEAGGCPQWLYVAADSMVANDNGRVLAIGNPDDPSSYFAECCEPDSKWNVIPISAFDTPRWTGEAVSARLLELLIGDAYVEEMRALGEDSHLWQSKVLGQFPDVSDKSLFPPRLLKQAIDADLPGLDQGGYGGDVARFGDSETVLYRNRGGVIRIVDSARQQATTATAEMFSRHVRRPAVGALPTYVDADGVGGGVVDQMRASGVPVLEFRGGLAARDSERFVNRRAEVFWQLRTDMEAGLIDLDENDKPLLAQLGRIRYDHDGRGRIKIESKDEMRKRGVKSPDRADGVVMAYAAPPLLNLREETERAVEHAQKRGDAGFVNLGSAPAPDAFGLSDDLMWREM